MYENVNRTELVQFCRRAGHSLSPVLSHEKYTKALTGEEVVSDKNPVDEWRDVLIDFMLDYWTQVSSQLKCPAKDLYVHTERPSPTTVRRLPGLPAGEIACRTCTDAQVLCCLLRNEKRNNIVRK